MTVSEDVVALLSTDPSEWTDALETRLIVALREAVADGGVFRVSVPCTDAKVVAHFTAVNDRILIKNGDVLLAGGRIWDKKIVQWTFQGYSEKTKKAIEKYRKLDSR